MKLSSCSGIPLAAVVHLAHRRGELSCRVSGRVAELEALALPGSAMSSDSGRGAILEGASGAVEPFDTVIALGALHSSPDPETLLAHIMGALAPAGQLIFVEPSRRPGFAGRLQRRAGFDIDVVSLVRAAGFTVTNLHRAQIETADPRYRWFVEGVAQRTTELRAND